MTDQELSLEELFKAAPQVNGTAMRGSWRVSDRFVDDRIIVCVTQGETFYFVHPDHFQKVAAAHYAAQTPAQRKNPLLGLNAVSLDVQLGDTAEEATRRMLERERCLAAFAATMRRSLSAPNKG